ncbi:DEKNAAC102147 [Brettanomyces naardenensis]|uniref:Cleavage and polyadenylation specificity factor subunit 2 n=1 Tax=Brettanomyces naardenensis TaxID=13370 RepID=A0A448YK01_BRENA|nr:DEKNAAC102147 [Brettanomyces naardenensis]
MFEFLSLAPQQEIEVISDTSEAASSPNDSYDPMMIDESDEEESQEEPRNPLENVSSVQARLITFDHETNILADPGWDGVTDLSYLESVIPKIDLILLSQTTVEYLGALAYLLYKYPILKKIKIYATLPIVKLGRLSTIELYRSVGLIGAVDGSLMEVDDIESCFNSIIPLNYAQSINLQGKLAGITITAYNSGHTLGGSVWLFNKEAEKVVYAPVWNHSKDLFLKPCRFLNQSTMNRPTTFVTGSDLGSSMSHRNRIDSFLQLVQLTLYNGTSIMMPTSISGRFFEILPILDQKVPREIPFYLVSYTGIQSLKSSSNMLEWMSPDITKNWETQSRTPFDSTRIQLITIEDLIARGSNTGPKIVFVEGLGFNEGSLARPAFIELCSRQNTALFLTERPSIGTVLYDVYKSWEDTVSKDGNMKDGSLIIFEKEFSMKVAKEVPLRGKELNSYLKRVDDRRTKRKEMEFEERKNDDLLDNDVIGDEGEDEELEEEDEEEDDEEEEEEEEEEALKTGVKKVTKAIEEIGPNGTLTISGALSKSHSSDEDARTTAKDLLQMPMDFDIRTVKANKNRMFPFIADKFSIDDYGIEINHDDFKRDEERFSLKRDFEESVEDAGDDLRGTAAGRKRRRTGQFGETEQVSTLYSMDPKQNPVSRTSSTKKVAIRCGLTFIDLSGLADLRSWKFNANGLKPRKVIVLPNTTFSGYLGDAYDIMESLVKQQRNKLGLHGIHSGKEPYDNKLNTFHSQSSSGVLGIDFIRGKLNETIDLGSVISSYFLHLADSLDKELQWQVITGGYSLSHISGEVSKASEMENGKKNLFRLVPSDKNIKATNNKISIGDVKLNELRKRLRDMNHVVEFKGDGTLVVDSQLAVRKITDGNLMIDGGTGALFYEVREQIQSMLAYV